MGQTNLLFETRYFYECMLVTFISYELARVNKPNLKMQEIAPYDIAVTGTQKWLHVDLLNTAATVLNYTKLVSTLQRCLIYKLPAL